jgi:hypothetical protein
MAGYLESANRTEDSNSALLRLSCLWAVLLPHPAKFHGLVRAATACIAGRNKSLRSSFSIASSGCCLLSEGEAAPLLRLASLTEEEEAQQIALRDQSLPEMQRGCERRSISPAESREKDSGG